MGFCTQSTQYGNPAVNAFACFSAFLTKIVQLQLTISGGRVIANGVLPGAAIRCTPFTNHRTQGSMTLLAPDLAPENLRRECH
jgi:hypothetical protein